jgi:antirestriction protein
MIEIHLREHSTHNAGYGFDKHFDLDNYTSADEIIQELMEQTKNTIIENGLNVNDFLPLEEWLITDLEIDSDYLNYNDVGFYEYMSIDKLLKINEDLKEDNDLIIKLYMEAFGSDIEEALEKVNEGDLNIIELEDLSFKNENQLLGEYFVDNAADYGLDIPDHLIPYIDTEKYGRDLGMDYTVHTFKNGESYAIRND